MVIQTPTLPPPRYIVARTSISARPWRSYETIGDCERHCEQSKSLQTPFTKNLKNRKQSKTCKHSQRRDWLWKRAIKNKNKHAAIFVGSSLTLHYPLVLFTNCNWFACFPCDVTIFLDDQKARKQHHSQGNDSHSASLGCLSHAFF